MAILYKTSCVVLNFIYKMQAWVGKVLIRYAPGVHKMAKLIDMITTALAPLDAEVREASKKWAVERMAAIRTFKYADASKCGSSEWYAQLFSIAGGKTWFNLLDGRSAEDAAEVAARNADSIARKRNATIAAKLTKAGVDEVEGAEFARTSDGFNGLFVVNTPGGRRVFSLRRSTPGATTFSASTSASLSRCAEMYYVHAATAVVLVIAVAWAVWGSSSRAANAIVTITDRRSMVRRATDQK